MGFCACFQFGSGITWLSSNIPDMSSRQVSLIFLGSNLANCVFPALASKLFNDLGPNWVFYLTMLSLILTILCFLAMYTMCLSDSSVHLKLDLFSRIGASIQRVHTRGLSNECTPL